MTSFDKKEILSWFTGKSLTNAAVALELLKQSEDQEFWLKNASRKVRAALNKGNVAIKLGRIADEFYEAAEFAHSDKARCYKSAWHCVGMALTYGDCYVARVLPAVELLRQQPAADAEAHLPLVWDKRKLESVKRTMKDREELLLDAASFARALGPAVALMDELDSRRPPINIVMKTLSPTVARTLVGDLPLKLNTMRYPKFVSAWVERLLPNGTKVEVREVTIIWPDGTVHNKSRFARWDRKTRAWFDQCHACGHAIKNALNWVPFVVDGEDGTPYSFWVGSDCARKVFGCEVSGEAEYKNRVLAQAEPPAEVTS